MSRSIKGRADGGNGKGLKEHYRCDKLKIITSRSKCRDVHRVFVAAQILFLPLFLHVAPL